MNHSPLISIIIPIYNADKYISSCLDSCVNQTYQNIEILAINDGSKDNSEEILNAFSHIDKRIKVIYQPNKGTAAARETGLKNATGEWIAFVDSDDTLPLQAIEKLLSSVLQYKSQISIGTFSLCNNALKSIHKTIPIAPQQSDNMHYACYLLTEKISFSLSAKLIHKSLFNNIKTNKTIKLGEDAYVTIQLINNASKISIINDIVYNYIQHPLSISHAPSKTAINSILLFITKTIEYYSIQDYFENKQFQISLNYFIMKEYFTYLRMGGKYEHNEITERINTICLHDSQACKMTPCWRTTLLRAYKNNVIYGKMIRYLIILIRKIRG